MESYGNPFSASQPLHAGSDDSSERKAYYGMSQVFTVLEVHTTAWSILSTPAAAGGMPAAVSTPRPTRSRSRCGRRRR